MPDYGYLLLYVTIIIFIIFAYFGKHWFKTYFNPVTILFISWIPGMVILSLKIFPFFPSIKPYTFFILWLGMFCFCAGVFFPLRKYQIHNAYSKLVSFEEIHIAFLMLSTLGVISTIVGFFLSINIMKHNIKLYEAYLYNTYFHVSGFGLGYLYDISFILMGLAAFLFANKYKHKWFLAILMITWFIMYFFAFQRSNIVRGAIAACIGVMIAGHYSKKKFTIKVNWFKHNLKFYIIAAIILIFALVFVCLFGHLMQEHDYNWDYRHLWKRNMVSCPKFFVPFTQTMLYFSMPLPSFDKYLNEYNFERTHGYYTFRFFLVYFYRLFGKEWVQALEPMSFGGIKCNVYGFFYNAHRDFGLFGLIVFSFIYGWLSIFYYKRAVIEKRLAYLGPYCCISFILGLGFFSNQFSSPGFFWLIVFMPLLWKIYRSVARSVHSRPKKLLYVKSQI